MALTQQQLNDAENSRNQCDLQIIAVQRVLGFVRQSQAPIERVTLVSMLTEIQRGLELLSGAVYHMLQAHQDEYRRQSGHR